MTDLTFIDSLRAIVGDRGVVTEATDLETYNIDWRHIYHGKARCAVLPRNTQEVSAVVRLCASVGVPMVPHKGSISAEHGIGQYRVVELERCRSLPELELARRVKHALDSSGLMNPGKVLTLLNVEK